jgi:hypothetical protein
MHLIANLLSFSPVDIQLFQSVFFLFLEFIEIFVNSWTFYHVSLVEVSLFQIVLLDYIILLPYGII